MFEQLEKGDKYAIRREVVFIIISGIFIGSLAMLNIIGISRQVDLSFSIFGLNIPVILFVGVLPYPITFLCTDFISELYGRRRANIVVWTGLLLNIWVLFILWLGGVLPTGPNNQSDVYFEVQKLAFGATGASMIAYITAQFIDVHLFHALKIMTKGKHLWLRNNGSTLVSQLVDSFAVVLITYYWAEAINIEEGAVFDTLLILIFSGYIFKFLSAIIDTLPFYFGVKFLSKYLDIKPNKDYETENK